jgi:LPS-assembly lipoprotein
VASWTLENAATAVTMTGQARTFTSYSTTGSTVATQTAQADAEERLSVALADLVVTQLLSAMSAQ